MTTSVESEGRNVFGTGHQACFSIASSSSPAVIASQNGPLYTMRRSFTNFQTANYRSSRGGKRKGATPSGSFSHDVILLSGPEDEDVPHQGNRVFLQESGHAIMAFPFKKEWSDLEVELKIREAFQDIISRLVDFEILQSVYAKLLEPMLAQGQYLTGAMIHHIFRDKPIYVRPTQQRFQNLRRTILAPFMKAVLMKMLTYLQPFTQVLQIRKGAACPLVRRLMLS